MFIKLFILCGEERLHYHLGDRTNWNKDTFLPGKLCKQAPITRMNTGNRWWLIAGKLFIIGQPPAIMPEHPDNNGDAENA